ncbi:MAG: cytochrome c [Minicystis sp.]
MMGAGRTGWERPGAAVFGGATVILALITAAVLVDRPAAKLRVPDEGCAALDAAAWRGKRIFRRGETDKGPIEGLLDRGVASLEGRSAACASCHGPAGEGSKASGVTVPSIRPERLFGPGGRGYDRASLAFALRDGRTPEGRALRPPMPRYRFRDGDMADLGAYLRCLEQDHDPRVADDAPR